MKGYREIQNRMHQLEQMNVVKDDQKVVHRRLQNQIHSMLGYTTNPGRREIETIKHKPKKD